MDWPLLLLMLRSLNGYSGNKSPTGQTAVGVTAVSQFIVQYNINHLNQQDLKGRKNFIQKIIIIINFLLTFKRLMMYIFWQFIEFGSAFQGSLDKIELDNIYLTAVSLLLNWVLYLAADSLLLYWVLYLAAVFGPLGLLLPLISILGLAQDNFSQNNTDNTTCASTWSILGSAFHRVPRPLV